MLCCAYLLSSWETLSTQLASDISNVGADVGADVGDPVGEPVGDPVNSPPVGNPLDNADDDDDDFMLVAAVGDTVGSVVTLVVLSTQTPSSEHRRLSQQSLSCAHPGVDPTKQHLDEKREAREGEGRGSHVMHGRSRMTIYRPSHPYNTGMEHVGFFTDPSLQAGTLLAPSAKKRRGVFGESHEG